MIGRQAFAAAALLLVTGATAGSSGAATRAGPTAGSIGAAPPGATASNVPFDGFAPLAGVWTGVRTVRARTGCRLDREARPRRKVRLKVRIAPDGSPAGELAFADGPGAAPPQFWRGWVDGDQLRFETTETMTCRGTRFDYAVRPTGRMPVRRDGRRTTMRLAAEESACGCAYDVDYELKWTAPAAGTPTGPSDR